MRIRVGKFSKRSPLSITFMVAFAAVMTYILVRAFAATGPATMYISPGGTQSATVGQTFSVAVRISTASDVPVTGAAVYLTYPADKLQMVGVNYSGSPYSTELTTVNGTGLLRMDRAAFPMISGGDQLFAQVSFKTLASGSASLGFSTSSIVTSGDNDSNLLGQKNGVTYNITAAAPSGGGSSGSTSSSPGGTSVSTSSGSSSGTRSGSTSGVSGSGGSRASSSGSDGSATAGGSTTTGAGGNTSVATAPDGTPITNLKTSQVSITVVDSQNKPVENAEVTVGNQTVKTDSKGVAHFAGVPLGDVPVTVSYNGKKTSKTVNVQEASTQSPQVFKVSIKRNHYNPIIIVAPLLLLVAAVTLILRPWDQLRLRRATVEPPTGIVSSDETSPVDQASAGIQPGQQYHNKVETPGTVYSPTPTESSQPQGNNHINPPQA